MSQRDPWEAFPADRQRRWLWGLAATLIVCLCGTLALLLLVISSGEFTWLPVPETNGVAVIGLVGMVSVFVLYASQKQRLLEEWESQLRHAQAREAALRERLAELSGLLETTTDMAQTVDLPTMLNLALRRVRVSLGADHASLMLFNPATGCLEVKAASGLDAELALEASVRPGQGVVGLIHVAAEARVLDKEAECVGLATELRLAHPARSGICVPLSVKGNPMGLLNVVRAGEGEPLTPFHVNVLSTFAEHLAAVFLRSEYYRALLKGEQPALRGREEQVLHRQKMESVGRVAAGVAHDFNNLLTGIVGYSRLVSDHVEDRERVRQYAKEICGAGERAGALTRKLLAFARKQVLEPRSLDFNVLLAEMRDMLKRVLPENIELLVRLAPSLDHVYADPGQMTQVIMNLVTNARDVMPEGGKITIETINTVVDDHVARHASFDRPGRYVLLAVTDTGPGMDARTRARIFEPFFTTKERGKGEGLGLAIVYGIVKQSGGHITCYSEPEWGTSFKVYLPRVEGADAVVDPVPSAPAIADGRRTVLVVEDEEFVRAVTRTILQDAGYQVLEARDGAEALRLCEERREPIHVLLTDVVMPKLSGPELVQRLAPLKPEIRVLFTSGYPEGALAQHGVLEPRVHFIGKPFTPEALLLKIREVLAAPASGDPCGPPRGLAEAA